MIEFKVKKPTYKELALYLGVTESAIKQYNKDKRRLMLLGLRVENESKFLETKV